MTTPRPLIALLLLSAFAAPAVLAAPTPPPEVPVLGSGRYEEDTLSVWAWKPKALTQAATVAVVELPAGGTKAGALTLTVEGLDDALAEAHKAVAQAERALAFEAEDSAAQAGELLAAKTRAIAEAQVTAERRKHWQEAERAESLADAAQKVEAFEARFRDDQEELRQLEQMYKEARIDSSTQDLVVNREKRKLKQNERELAELRAHADYYAKVEVAHKDGEFARAETEAALRQAAEGRRQTREKARQADALDKAQAALAQAKKRLKDLEADAAALTLPLPAEGRLELSVKTGEQVKPGQELGRLFAASGGSVKIEVQPTALAVLPVGAAVKLRFPETGVTVGATVTQVGWVGRPEGGKTLFPVVVRPARGDFSARPGLKVEVIK